MGRTHYRAKGGRWTTSERQRVRDAHRPDPSGRRPLESCLRSKDSRAVWRGTGRKGSNDLARGLLYLLRHMVKPSFHSHARLSPVMGAVDHLSNNAIGPWLG